MIIPILKELSGSTNRVDKLFYIACLKNIDRIGQRLYKLKPEKWLKEFLIKFYEKIKELEKNV